HPEFLYFRIRGASLDSNPWLSLPVVIVIQQLRPISFDTPRRLFQRLVRWLYQPCRHRPGRSENFWIIDCDLVREVFADAPKAFGNTHGIGVEISLLPKPGVIDEIRGFHDQCVSLPAPNRVTVI